MTLGKRSRKPVQRLVDDAKWGKKKSKGNEIPALEDEEGVQVQEEEVAEVEAIVIDDTEEVDEEEEREEEDEKEEDEEEGDENEEDEEEEDENEEDEEEDEKENEFAAAVKENLCNHPMFKASFAMRKGIIKNIAKIEELSSAPLFKAWEKSSINFLNAQIKDIVKLVYEEELDSSIGDDEKKLMNDIFEMDKYLDKQPIVNQVVYLLVQQQRAVASKELLQMEEKRKECLDWTLEAALEWATNVV